MLQTQGNICALSGVPIYMAKSSYEHRRDKGSASLDRVDSTKGYVPGNIQWVHKAVNKLKMTMPDKELIAWCTLVADFAKSKPKPNSEVVTPCQDSILMVQHLLA